MNNTRKKKRLSLDQFTNLSDRHRTKLVQEGITDISTLAAMNQHELRAMLDTTINKARAILAEARFSLPDFLVRSLSELQQDQKSRYTLATGVPQMDTLLGGRGFQSGAITQIAGEFGAGKSQIALAMCVKAALQGVVVVVDTEGTWKVCRIMEIAHEWNYDQSLVRKNLRIIQPLTSQQQAHTIRAFLQQQGTRMNAMLKMQPEERVRLLVIDSVTGLFRMQYPGRAVLAERQHHLAEYLKNLYVFARKYNAIVLVTNQVIHSPDIFSPGMRAVGGNVVGHACTIRTTLRKKRGALRVLQMVDSAHLPMGQAHFLLTKKGIQEYAPSG